MFADPTEQIPLVDCKHAGLAQGTRRLSTNLVFENSHFTEEIFLTQRPHADFLAVLLHHDLYLPFLDDVNAISPVSFTDNYLAVVVDHALCFSAHDILPWNGTPPKPQAEATICLSAGLRRSVTRKWG
jgi:hypothetical protein